MAKGFGISDLASLGFGQVGQLLDTMDMMSKTWSGMALPAALNPTTSIEELDKRINDLRAIEQWLSLNQNMLRSTIQGLEVQRGTIATLQSFGQAMGVSPAGAEGGARAPWDPERLAALFAAAQQPAERQQAPERPTASPAQAEPTAAAGSAAAGPADHGPAGADDGGQTAASPDATQLAQAWWNMLNEQFQQIAGAAIGGMAAGEAARAAADTGAAGPASSAAGRTAADAASPSGRPRRAPNTAASRAAKPGGRKRAPRSP